MSSTRRPTYSSAAWRSAAAWAIGAGSVSPLSTKAAAATEDLGRADRLLREALLLFDDNEDGPGVGRLLDLGLDSLMPRKHASVRRDSGESSRPSRWTFRPRAWAQLTLAALERRCGDEVAAARCLDEARRGFLALADEPGLAYLDSHA